MGSDGRPWGASGGRISVLSSEAEEGDPAGWERWTGRLDTSCADRVGPVFLNLLKAGSKPAQTGHGSPQLDVN